MSTIKRIRVSGNTYDLASGANVIEVTQSEYNALASGESFDSSALYVITDATAIDAASMEDYYRKDETSGSTQISNALSAKQNALVSGANIKTINGNSLLGRGDITIEGGGSNSNVVVDSALSSGSTNPLQNKAISNELAKKVDLTKMNTINGAPLVTTSSTIINYTIDKINGVNLFNTYNSSKIGDINMRGDWNVNTTSNHRYIDNRPFYLSSVTESSEVVYDSGGVAASALTYPIQFIYEGDLFQKEEILQRRLKIDSVKENKTVTNGCGMVFDENENKYKCKIQGVVFLESSDLKHFTLLNDNNYNPHLPFSLRFEITKNYYVKLDSRYLNTVSEINSSALDSQIPTAKAVYDHLGGLKLIKITQSDYDALETKDANTLYVVNG